MKMYTISELAALLNVNEETIRRWRIRGRNGVRLECIVGIGKQGHRVTSDALARFFDLNPGLCPPALAEELVHANGGESLAVSYGVAKTEIPVDKLPTPSETNEVIQSIIRDKQERRGRLLEELQQIDREILVLQQIEKK